MKRAQNPFVAMLDLLNVKYTQEFSNKLFNEHPHKYNLFGLSKMLSDYGVENAGTKIADKENDLCRIEYPFIAHFSGDFVVVYKIEASKVHYIWNGKEISITVQQFIQSWSGIILLAEKAPDSIEPDYQEHRKKELWGIAQKSFLILAGVLIFGITYTTRSLFANLGVSLLLLVNLIGIYIGYLLILKQMHIRSQYADKICSLFSKSDCNNVLETDAAKLWGIFGWSEIGLGYFTANVILLLFSPQTIFLLAVINIFALPYTFWSVWYQKTKAHQWCPLCLIVQVLLWSVFILNLLFEYIQLPEFGSTILKDLLFFGCTYAIFVFGFNLLIPSLGKGGEMEQIKQEINSVKTNEEVFKTLLIEQPHYEVRQTDSQILFGNPDATLKITVFTNPFCNPCAKMHKRVITLLKDTRREVCIQYIFSSFTPDLDYANKYLIAAWLKNCHCGLDPQSPEQIITDWFAKGKPLKEVFFENLHLDINNADVETEFQKHEAWKAIMQLRATPTILVDGYKLPDNYKIEDLRFFIDFNVNIK